LRPRGCLQPGSTPEMSRFLRISGRNDLCATTL
jgi:hypothetical protein